nr:hypothetical protein [Nocardioides sp. S5]
MTNADPRRPCSSVDRGLVRRHVQLVTDHQTEISVFFEERKHLGADRRLLVEQRRDAYESYAVSLIQAGISRGVFVDLDPRLVAQAVLSAMTEMYHWYSPAGALTPSQIADEYIDLFLHGAVVDRAKGLGATRVKKKRSGNAGATSATATARERVRAAAVVSFVRPATTRHPCVILPQRPT